MGVANISRAAEAAVAAASTELTEALAGANTTITRSQQQDPEVSYAFYWRTYALGCVVQASALLRS